MPSAAMLRTPPLPAVIDHDGKLGNAALAGFVHKIARFCNHLLLPVYLFTLPLIDFF